MSNLTIRGSNSSPERRDTVIIECHATANPPANIMWMKRGANERTKALVNSSRTFITNWLTYTPSGPVSRTMLTISNVEARDNGNFICEASNGPSVSANFTICVIGKCQLILETIQYNLHASTFIQIL